MPPRRSDWELHSSSSTHIIDRFFTSILLIAAGGFPIFFSLMIKDYDDVKYFKLPYQGFTWSSIAMLTLLVPIGLDRAFDLARRLETADASRSEGMEIQLTDFEFLFVCVGCASISMLYLVGTSLQTYLASRSFCYVLVVGAIMLSISRVEADFWSRWQKTLALLCVVASQIFRVYYDLFRSEGETHMVLTLRFLWMLSSILVIAVFNGSGAMWIYKTFVRSCTLNKFRIVNKSTAATSKGKSNLFMQSFRRPFRKHVTPVADLKNGGEHNSAFHVFRSISSRKKIFESKLDKEIPLHFPSEDDHYRQTFVLLGLICSSIAILSSVTELTIDGYNSAAFIVSNSSYTILLLMHLLVPMRNAKFAVVLGQVRQVILLTTLHIY